MGILSVFPGIFSVFLWHCAVEHAHAAFCQFNDVLPLHEVDGAQPRTYLEHFQDDVNVFQ